LVCAVWNDQGKVQIWNLGSALRTVETLEGRSKTEILKSEKPLFSFSHNVEGFALDWSPLQPGRLASGDNRRNIHLWAMGDGGTWTVNQIPYNAHKGSVEEIQWSPTEADVFASCSADHSIRLWDARVTPKSACVCAVDEAHESDVNVLSWNRAEPLLCSGGDDFLLKIWDLRILKSGQAVAQFKQHSAPICSVQWNPNDSTVFAAAGEDNVVSLWDLAVEADSEQNGDDEELKQVPPQLLFIHQGQNEPKEIRWFPQCPGVLGSTASDGFNIFKSISV